MRTYAGSCLEPRTTIWQVSLVAVDLSSRGQGGLFWCISVCFPGQSSRWYYIPRQLFKTLLMTCQHSTFKNNDDFHSFTRETKQSLMQGVQQRLIIIVLMFCTILFMIRIYLFLSYRSTSAILATDVCPRGVEDRFTSVAKTADVESCLTKQIN